MFKVVASLYQSTRELTEVALVSGAMILEGRQGQQGVGEVFDEEEVVVKVELGDGVVVGDLVTMGTSSSSCLKLSC